MTEKQKTELATRLYGKKKYGITPADIVAAMPEDVARNGFDVYDVYLKVQELEAGADL